MALLVVRHHHYNNYYSCYCYCGNVNSKELAFFKCRGWNNVVAVLQPSRARLLQIMLLAWPGVCRDMGALGWHWITSQGDGQSHLAGLGEISKSCSRAKLKCWCRCTCSVCTDVTLLQQSKLPSARMKCYLKNASSCKLASLLPRSNDPLANHLLALHLPVLSFAVAFADHCSWSKRK